MLLDAYEQHGVIDAWYALLEQGIPEKVLIAAIERDCRRDILDYGTTVRGYFPIPQDLQRT